MNDRLKFTSKQPIRQSYMLIVKFLDHFLILWKHEKFFGKYVVFTKTITHLGVGESGGYLPPL